MEEVVTRILISYGFTEVELLSPGKGYRNQSFPARLPDGSMLNLMLYKREPGMQDRIRRANSVSDFAYRQGLPARHTHDDRIVRIASSRGERYAALYDYLPGATVPWEAYTMKHLKLLGKSMSDLHAALSDFDTTGMPPVVDEYLEIITRMRTYFARSGVQQALRGKLQLVVDDNVLAEFETLMHLCKHLPDQQALHMDFVRSNILFGETRGELAITGILDFEKAAYGSPLFDIARTLAFLLVDCKYKQPDKIRKYFLLSGYQKRGAAEFKNITVTFHTDEINVLEKLVEPFLVYDFYKFLRHNPYEYLSHNEHFMRTKDILCERRLIYSSS